MGFKRTLMANYLFFIKKKSTHKNCVIDHVWIMSIASTTNSLFRRGMKLEAVDIRNPIHVR